MFLQHFNFFTPQTKTTINQDGITRPIMGWLMVFKHRSFGIVFNNFFRRCTMTSCHKESVKVSSNSIWPYQKSCGIELGTDKQTDTMITIYYIDSSDLPNVPSVIFFDNSQCEINSVISLSRFLLPKRHNTNINPPFTKF